MVSNGNIIVPRIANPRDDQPHSTVLIHRRISKAGIQADNANQPTIVEDPWLRRVALPCFLDIPQSHPLTMRLQHCRPQTVLKASHRLNYTPQVTEIGHGSKPLGPWQKHNRLHVGSHGLQGWVSIWYPQVHHCPYVQGPEHTAHRARCNAQKVETFCDDFFPFRSSARATSPVDMFLGKTNFGWLLQCVTLKPFKHMTIHQNQIDPCSVELSHLSPFLEVSYRSHGSGMGTHLRGTGDGTSQSEKSGTW